MDGLICSCQPLADDLAEWSGRPVTCIPDRIELSCYPLEADQENNVPMRFIWYGAAQNRIALFAALSTLDRLAANGVNISLTIFDDQPAQQWNLRPDYPIYYSEWREETENEVLASHNIALLPPYPGPWGKVKSNNKSLTAWANGLVVCDAQDYEIAYKMATDTRFRECQAAENSASLAAEYYAQKSGHQWREVLDV